MSVTIIKNGRVIDPAQNIDQIQDIWVKDNKIVEPNSVEAVDAQVIDVAECWVVPGLIDMHVHLREPGQEYKETIESGTDAAAAGGFTAVACMPNTNPVNDNSSVTSYIVEKGAGCKARVYPVGSISKHSKGDTLAEYAEMKDAGAVAVSDDGLPVIDSRLMRRAMEYGSSHDMVVISHSEEMSLSLGGCMNEGETSTRLGLRGVPAASESIMVYREIALAELTGAKVHIAHVSTKESIDLIRAAKKRGVPVTAETAPHYFTLTEKAVVGYNTNAKMNPPLRTEKDRMVICEALQDATLDVIATDHAPHSILEKELEFDLAANGIAGLETALPLTLNLVRNGTISPGKVVELMSVNPGKILGVEGGTLAIGSLADITVINPLKEYTFKANDSFSKGKNSPFDDWQLQGKVICTMMDGKIRYQDSEIEGVL